MTRTYNYRNTKVAMIWILVAISCVVAIVTLYNQAVEARSIYLAKDNASSIVNMVMPAPTAASQQIACYDGGAPVYDPAKCAVPTATAN
jgi:hypothetical protein